MEMSLKPDMRADGLTRRRFLSLAAWGVALALVPGAAEAARAPRQGVRRLAFHNLHTEERLSTVYWEGGAYVPAALEEIDAILRDHRTGEIRPIAPALIDLVHALSSHLSSPEPVRVISGYRSPATNAMLRGDDPKHVAENSLHLTGEAIDLCFSGRSLRRVRDTALALQRGGVGYYPRSGFVHVDVGRIRRW
jgi:uncharacterized protein YcbK (DUF882 family)